MRVTVMASCRFPVPGTDRPPILLIHGAASSAGIWPLWQAGLAEAGLAEAGWASLAVDLRGHGPAANQPLASVRMADYADDVRAVIAHLDRPPVLIGWSMGGLVALMVAAAGGVDACVALAPSTPARRVDPGVALREGEFGSAEYGIISLDPADQPAMPDLDLDERRVALAALGRESRLARDERRRGIVLPPLPCPLLIVTGSADTQWPRARYADFPLPADFLEIPGASHWGLVLSRRALATVIPRSLGWLDTALGDGLARR